MKYLFNILLALLLATSIYAQPKLDINFGVDTIDADVHKAIQFYRQYLNEFKHDTTPDFKKYWSKQDCEKYKCPDQVADIDGGGLYSSGYKRTITYIKPEKNYINIKTLFGVSDSLGLYAFCITNYYIKFDEQGHPSFTNVNSWQTKKVRNITYYFPPTHKFNQNLADSLIHRIEKFEKDWKVEPINIRYYFADSWEDMQKLKGFEWTYDMGNRDKPTGRTNYKDTIVYCAGWGENYFHEIVHIYGGRAFPNTALGEGLPVFYGGSMGHDLSWRIPRLKEYLNKHPEIDLNELKKFWYMDNYTNPNHTIQGVLCQVVYKKDGLTGLKRLMQYETWEDVMSKEFNVKPGEWNTFLRKLINEQ